MSKNTAISWADLSGLIESARTLVLTTHIHPDGDGLGCEVAMYHYLKSLGKSCRILNISAVPHQYEFLNPGGIIEYYTENDLEWIKTADLGLVFDVGDSRRIGVFSSELFNHAVTVSIDHHPLKSGEEFTHTINDLTAPATGVMIWQYLREAGGRDHLPKNIAEALYTALVTDTGSFRYSNTTEIAHEMAINLMQSGCVPHLIHRHVYENRRIPEVRLLGEVIRNLKFACSGKIAHFRITAATLKKCGAMAGDVDGFTDYARSIEGVEVSFMLLEISPEKTRLNFRSLGNVTVNDVARVYSGGGHKYASGATLTNRPMAEIEQEVIEMLSRKFGEKSDFTAGELPPAGDSA